MAKQASKLLTVVTGIPVEAHTMLAIVDRASIAFKKCPNDVSIMDAHALPLWLRCRKFVFSSETVQRISAAAHESRMWHRSADLTIAPLP